MRRGRRGWGVIDVLSTGVIHRLKRKIHFREIVGA
jgi:hypothetical protein